MNGLAWNPMWWHRAESFWSLLNKMAYANVTSPREILDFLGFSEAKGQRSLLFNPSAGRAVQLCLALELSPAAATSMFTAVGRLRFPVRQASRLAVRWCPVCLAQNFHSALFQNFWLSHCPWHGSLLLDSCPKCRRKIDPLAETAWTCNSCATKIHTPGLRWIDAFKSTPDHGVPVVARGGERLEYEDVPDAQGFTRYRRHDALAMPTNNSASSWQHAYSTLCVAYEEVAALTDTLFEKHRNCFAGEGRAAYPRYEPTTFTCPVAGANARVLGLFGAVAEAAHGGWIPQSIRAEGTLSAQVAYRLEAYPEWCKPLICQELVRGWISEALISFTEAAQNGSNKVAWRPSTFAGIFCKVESDVLFIKPNPQWPSLAERSHKAACCGTDKNQRTRDAA